MGYQFVPYVSFLFFSAGITFFLGFFCFCKLDVPGQTVFSFCMFICTYWSVCNAFEIMGTTLTVKLFWANMQYAAYAFSPVGLTVLVSQLTGYWHEVKIRNILFMLIIPTITSVLVWFDNKTGLVRYDFFLIRNGSFSFIQKRYGPWFWVHTAHTYGIYLFSAGMLIRGIIIQTKKIYKYQFILLLLSASSIFIPNLLYISGRSPVKNIDITPSLFFITGSILALSMFRYWFLNLVPVARETVFENMGESVIVTDREGRILDINSRTRKIFGLTAKITPGSLITDTVPSLFPVSPGGSVAGTFPDGTDLSLLRPSVIRTQYTEGGGIHEKYLERNCTPLTNRKGKKIIGWIYSISDITDIHDAEEKLRQQQQELAVSEEQQRVARDLHDNIGQILSFSGIQIQTISRELERGNLTLASEYLAKLKVVTDQAYGELRGYIFNLRQPYMQSVSFKKLITDMVNHMSAVFPVTCSLILPETIPSFFDLPEIKSHLFSLTKEAVNNSLKHSKATKISIGIEFTDRAVLYYIEDNGCGIMAHENNTKIRQTSGIKIMEERAMLTGGQLHIASSPGKGTRITVTYEGDYV
jgi:signal transduction histidine kinase